MMEPDNIFENKPKETKGSTAHIYLHRGNTHYLPNGMVVYHDFLGDSFAPNPSDKVKVIGYGTEYFDKYFSGFGFE